ncbi:TonB-dependent receptor [Chitinophaga sp. MM2321]|uniref:TonB-dependent receptor n=1 Tax=Chitinophaga sp. MM2321 TaxID=3137178 RepID=UPI0032D59440
MRMTTVFMLIACLHVSATGLSQGITLSVKNEPLKSVFKKISKQANISILFNDNDLKSTSLVSIDVNKVPLEQVLNECLKGYPLEYTIGNGIIRIRKKKYPVPTALPDITSAVAATLTGTVSDATGKPLQGATVLVKGMQLSTSTDAEGRFKLTVTNADDVELVFSFIGYKTQTVKAGTQREFNIVLEELVSGLNDIVVVGYGSAKKKDNTGAISTIKSEDLAKVPVSSVTNALVGKLPGLIAIQSSGQPGADASSLNIRGFGSALIIVDGVEADFRNIDANQIETVTILKDGAASIYGSRAGNGVVLITTKRGNIGKPVITLNATTTLQRPTYFQKMLNSGQYTTLVSESYLQSGQPANAVPYTQEQIDKYYAATEPGYYNTNWQKLIVRDWAPMQNYNVSIRGGSQKIRYYAFLGTLNQGSFWKKNGGDYKRYNFQSNVDANILDNLTMSITVSNIIDRINSTNRPQNGGGYLFADLYNNKPMYPASLPDPSKIPYSGSATGGALVQSNRDLGGYSDDHFQTASQTATLTYDVKAIKGLSLKAFGNYMQVNDNQKSYARPVDMYTYNVDTKEYTLASQYNSNTQLTQQKSVTTTLTGQFSLNYNRTINDIHQINAMALYEIYTLSSDFISAGRSDFTFPTLDQLFAGSLNTVSNNGSASEMSRKSYVGRLNYGYKERYLLGMILRADASAKFPAASRWGYFPSVSLGWRLSQEDFMKSFTDLDELKLRASYGASGNDGIGNFQYLAGYGATLMPALFGGVPVMGIAPLGMANPTLSWERIAIYNVGVDYSFFNRKLYGEAEVFYRKRDGIPSQKTVSLPSSFGAELPLENLNSQNNRGFELRVGTMGSSNHWKWDVSANVSWQRAKWDHVEEVPYTDPDSKRIYQLSGQWIDRTMGYISDGLFTSQDQIDKLGFTYPGNPVLKMGDVRYVDNNKDGVLDWKDEVEIGKGQIPQWMGGLNINLNYNNFDFSALIQGAFGYYKHVSLVSYTQTFFDNRWTAETNDPNALIPRLGGTGTNGLLSDRNFRKADYVRLKTFSIGYTLPKALMQKINFQSVRFYVGGSNLFTISGLNKFNLDPESPFTIQDGQPTTSYYPQMKTIMVGANISL